MLGLEYLVKQSEWNYTSLAKELEVSTQTVHRWATKIRPVPKHHLESLSKIFRVDKDYINQDLSPSVIAGVEKQDLKNSLDQSLLSFSSLNPTVNIAFQPTADDVAKHNFEKTINQPVSFSVIQDHLHPNELEDLRQMYNGKDVEVWGVKEGKNGSTKKQYDKLSVGDIVLFYKEWYLYCKAVVTYKVHSPSLAQELWDDSVFEHVYFLTDVEPIRVPVELMNETIYGKNHRFPIMGFKVLNSEKSESLINKLDLETEEQLKNYTDDDYKRAITLDIDKSLDSLAKRASRVEQGYLRRFLFGKKLFGVCASCGEYFPTSHLFTAHIKKRSQCSVEEKLDTQVVMPMCKFGCDTLFEDGYISVDSKGHFVRLDKRKAKVVTPRVQETIDEIEGRPCPFWNEDSAKYFKWHYDYHAKM